MAQTGGLVAYHQHRGFRQIDLVDRNLTVAAATHDLQAHAFSHAGHPPLHFQVRRELDHRQIPTLWSVDEDDSDKSDA